MNMPIIKYQADTNPKEVIGETNSLLTTSEVASLLHVHINTVRRWSNLRVLPSFRIGLRGDRRFLKKDILTFLKWYEQ
jgi:excisionase family DNA binding protein